MLRLVRTTTPGCSTVQEQDEIVGLQVLLQTRQVEDLLVREVARAHELLRTELRTRIPERNLKSIGALRLMRNEEIVLNGASLPPNVRYASLCPWELVSNSDYPLLSGCQIYSTATLCTAH